MPPVIYLSTIPGDDEGEQGGWVSVAVLLCASVAICIVSSSSLLILVPGGGCTS